MPNVFAAVIETQEYVLCRWDSFFRLLRRTQGGQKCADNVEYRCAGAWRNMTAPESLKTGLLRIRPPDPAIQTRLSSSLGFAGFPWCCLEGQSSSLSRSVLRELLSMRCVMMDPAVSILEVA